ncbi:unnamed protein product [Penicillium roqueforti FM164]|uniref:Genomic scaffold, ProqFM164S02 n=1 Tax=Penicillium roqueforti (strain FM164) TaxID=1365484 RepID=W6QC82_PENRF|nr:unnamed protein product [Penicillium roqueforti FM164]
MEHPSGHRKTTTPYTRQIHGSPLALRSPDSFLPDPIITELDTGDASKTSLRQKKSYPLRTVAVFNSQAHKPRTPRKSQVASYQLRRQRDRQCIRVLN